MINVYHFPASSRVGRKVISEITRILEKLFWSIFLLGLFLTVSLKLAATYAGQFPFVQMILAWSPISLNNLTPWAHASLGILVLLSLLAMLRKFLSYSDGAWIDVGQELSTLVFFGLLFFYVKGRGVQLIPLVVGSWIAMGVIDFLFGVWQGLWANRPSRQEEERQWKEEIVNAQKNKNWEEVVLLLEKILRLRPQNVNVLLQLAQVHEEKEEHEKALCALEIAFYEAKLQALGDPEIQALLPSIHEKTSQIRNFIHMQSTVK